MARRHLNVAKEYLFITVGCFLFSTSLNYFFISNHLAEGGATGICLIMRYLFNFPISITYLAINIPLLIIGWKFLGREFLLKTVFGTLCMSLFMALTSRFRGPTDDIMLATVYGGLISGIGLGLIFMVDGSTGGTDIIAILINKHFDIPIGRVLLIIDVIILSVVALIFGKRIVMYTLIAKLIISKSIDYFQDGYKKSKEVIIFSSKYEEIRDRIIKDADRGVTLVKAEGGYSHKYLPMIFCITSKFDLNTIKNIVRDVDPEAFLTVSDVSEVLGKGFNPLKRK